MTRTVAVGLLLVGALACRERSGELSDAKRHRSR
jgi:hypothetical protein